MKREAHGELADRPPPRRQARRGASKGSERKVCSDSEFVKDEWRIRRTTVLDEVFGEDPWRRVLTEATAGNLDEVDKAMDATVFADPEILPEPAAYDLKRSWSQVADFDRWGIEPEKALFWTHVESQLGLSIPNGDTVPSIHWPGHDLGNSYVEVPPPESRIRIYPRAIDPIGAVSPHPSRGFAPSFSGSVSPAPASKSSAARIASGGRRTS